MYVASFRRHPLPLSAFPKPPPVQLSGQGGQDWARPGTAAPPGPPWSRGCRAPPPPGGTGEAALCRRATRVKEIPNAEIIRVATAGEGRSAQRPAPKKDCWLTPPPTGSADFRGKHILGPTFLQSSLAQSYLSLALCSALLCDSDFPTLKKSILDGGLIDND